MTRRDAPRSRFRDRRIRVSERGVLDTSTLILLGRITAIDAVSDAAFITAATLAELSVGPLVATTDDDRVARQAHLQAEEADFGPLPFDAAAARAFDSVAEAQRPRSNSAGPRRDDRRDRTRSRATGGHLQSGRPHRNRCARGRGSTPSRSRLTVLAIWGRAISSARHPCLAGAAARGRAWRP